jgi:hypothetical protein
VAVCGGACGVIEPGLGDEVISRVSVRAPRWWLVHPWCVGVRCRPAAWLRRRELDVPRFRPPRTDAKNPGPPPPAERWPASARSDAFTRLPPRQGMTFAIFNGAPQPAQGRRLSHGALEAYIANFTSAVAGPHPGKFSGRYAASSFLCPAPGPHAHITKGRKAGGRVWLRGYRRERVAPNSAHLCLD